LPAGRGPERLRKRFRNAAESGADHLLRASVSSVELAGTYPGGERGPLSRDEHQDRAGRVATLAELMARLGHSTPGAALRYQHAAKDRDRVIADALSKLVTGDVTMIEAGKQTKSRRRSAS
jgi:hypothetical protein